MTMSKYQPDFGNVTWLLDGDGADYCATHNNDLLCAEYVRSNYDYHINLAVNVFFLTIFALATAAYATMWTVTRRTGVFTIAFCLGLLCEILGYVGRIMSWNNPWSQKGFIMQLCCLTIGPAFMAAGLYLCLGRIVEAFGQENSRIPPKYYTRIVSEP